MAKITKAQLDQAHQLNVPVEENDTKESLQAKIIKALSEPETRTLSTSDAPSEEEKQDDELTPQEEEEEDSNDPDTPLELPSDEEDEEEDYEIRIYSPAGEERDPHAIQKGDSVFMGEEFMGSQDAKDAGLASGEMNIGPMKVSFKDGYVQMVEAAEGVDLEEAENRGRKSKEIKIEDIRDAFSEMIVVLGEYSKQQRKLGKPVQRYNKAKLMLTRIKNRHLAVRGNK